MHVYILVFISTVFLSLLNYSFPELTYEKHNNILLRELSSKQKFNGQSCHPGVQCSLWLLSTIATVFPLLLCFSVLP